MRLLCKIFETLKIDEDSHADNESHWIKKRVGIIYRIVANFMDTHIILRQVSGYCALSIWECLMPEEVTNIYHFCYNL